MYVCLSTIHLYPCLCKTFSSKILYDKEINKNKTVTYDKYLKIIHFLVVNHLVFFQII
jgi:hypothetical protein